MCFVLAYLGIIIIWKIVAELAKSIMGWGGGGGGGGGGNWQNPPVPNPRC